MPPKPLKHLSVWAILLALMAQYAQSQINISGDFLSGPTGSPLTNTDPAFWTSGGDPNSDGIIGVTSGGLLTLEGGSILDIHHLDLGQNQGGSGTVNVSNGASIEGKNIAVGSNFLGIGTMIIEGAGTTVSAVENGIDGPGSFTVDELDGRDYAVAVPVPEPSTATTLLGAALLLAAHHRCRPRSAAALAVTGADLLG